ncbi:MAG: hypothetical protein ACTSRW_12470 [Candidatus Helarchaeota archaeon]
MVVNRESNGETESSDKIQEKRKFSQRERKKRRDQVSDLEMAEQTILNDLNKWNAAIEINKKMQVEYLQQAEQEKTLRDDLKEEIDDLRKTALEAKEKRDSINKKVSELKIRRNEINKKVTELKKMRNSLYEQVKSQRNGLKDILKMKRDLKDQLKGSNRERKEVRDLERKINSIEWYHQTNVISWEEEKMLMDRVATLYQELALIREDRKNDEIEKQHDEITQTLTENFNKIDTWKEEASKYHQQMIESVAESEKIHNEILNLVQESEKNHKTMIENFEKVNQLRKKQEQAHESYIRNLKEWDFLKKGIEPALQEIDFLKKRLARVRYGMLRRRRSKGNRAIDKKTENAIKKYKVGEKLTFEEFKILFDRGLINKKEA